MTHRGWLGLTLGIGGIALLFLAFALSREPLPPAEEVLARPKLERRIRVEVLNAAGIPGLARQATNRLRDRGFDVVYYGNARSYHPDTSYVVDRTGDSGPAREVAGALGIARVATRPDPALYLEVTVILGRDWHLDTPAPTAPSDPAEP